MRANLGKTKILTRVILHRAWKLHREMTWWMKQLFDSKIVCVRLAAEGGRGKVGALEMADANIARGCIWWLGNVCCKSLEPSQLHCWTAKIWRSWLQDESYDASEQRDADEGAVEQTWASRDFILTYELRINGRGFMNSAPTLAVDWIGVGACLESRCAELYPWVKSPKCLKTSLRWNLKVPRPWLSSRRL